MGSRLEHPRQSPNTAFWHTRGYQTGHARHAQPTTVHPQGMQHAPATIVPPAPTLFSAVHLNPAHHGNPRGPARPSPPQSALGFGVGLFQDHWSRSVNSPCQPFRLWRAQATRTQHGYYNTYQRVVGQRLLSKQPCHTCMRLSLRIFLQMQRCSGFVFLLKTSLPLIISYLGRMASLIPCNRL